MSPEIHPDKNPSTWTKEARDYYIAFYLDLDCVEYLEDILYINDGGTSPQPFDPQNNADDRERCTSRLGVWSDHWTLTDGYAWVMTEQIGTRFIGEGKTIGEAFVICLCSLILWRKSGSSRPSY